jgi:hypothetical protein
MRAIGMGSGDVMMNYDFPEELANGNNVDWAVSLIFYNYAWIDKVKSIANGSYWMNGSAMHEWMFDNGSSWVWDSDGGKKTDTPSCLGSTRHYRIYAPNPPDYMYNPTFGYYLIGTTHYDHHELCGGWFDDSEGTETSLANLFSGKGYIVSRNWGWWYNQEIWNDGSHHWNNNGYASYFLLT